MPTTFPICPIIQCENLGTVPILQMRQLRSRKAKEESAYRQESQVLKQDLSTPKPMAVLFHQDDLEKSQGLRFPIA